ncbi:MAG: hypothetical protein OJF49_002385 [Ktedonobacterales bacterium]|jgi:signal transduction histidine kinase|nr:MAG: hypothetical protein OJF49_002385 [Ktedonobacterales bacterium]
MTEEPRKRGGRRASAAAANQTPQPPTAATPTPAATPLPTVPSPAPTPTTPKPRAARSRARHTAPPPTSAAAAVDAADASAPKRTRRAGGRGRARESAILGLVERARITSELRPTLPPPDLLTPALPDLRLALLNGALDEAARTLTATLAATLAPATAQLWIADLAPWASARGRIGGEELAPALRLRADATSLRAHGAIGAEGSGALEAGSEWLPRSAPSAGQLVREVAAARRPIVYSDAADPALTGEWVERLAAPLPLASPTALGTLAAYPLRARGQFFGVLAVGAQTRLNARHLQTLEELADLTALAADRDRLLSYSRSQEALSQTVVRHTPVAVAVLTGAEHTFALSNPTFNLLLGLDSELSLTDRRLDDVLPERAAGFATMLRLDAAYTSGEAQAMTELPVHQPDRGMTYWNVTSSPLAGSATGADGVLVVAVDVTRLVQARQRAQEVAEVAQERIAQMMTLHATSLVVASQLGADPSELLADILRRSIALLSARAGMVYVCEPRYNDLEVLVSQGLRHDYSGTRLHAGEGLAGRVVQARKGMLVDDYRLYPARAAIYDAEDPSAIIAVPLIQRGQVIGVLEVVDGAELRVFTDDDLWLLDLFAAQAAQAIENARTFVELERAYRKQRELDRMKDDFIATASHELRTPLTGVQGFLELLVDYTGSRDDARARDFLRRAADSAQELAEIAERLLQTSRLDTGRFELHTSPVRLASVVDAVLRSYRELQQAQGGNHELLAEVRPDLYVRADLSRLKEVLENLVSNAIKYSPHGGSVVVRCVLAEFGTPISARETMPPATAFTSGSIEERPTLVMPQFAGEDGQEGNPTAPLPALVTLAAAQPYFIVTVSDQGMGIPPDERARLFERFARTDSARASQIRGTGLGLYICRQIVRGMGGDIWLHESAANFGSTFAFMLPAAQPDDITDNEHPAAPLASAGHFA